MKTKHLFLMVLLFSILFSEVVGLVMADLCDWQTVGDTFTPFWNKKVDPTHCYGKFDTGVYETNWSTGTSIPDGQQIVAMLGSSTEHLILPVGTYVNIYDYNFNLETQKSLGGTIFSTVDVLDFWGDGSQNDIAVIYEASSTIYSFVILSYNNVSGALNKTFEANFTTSAVTRGVPPILRHSSGTVQFFYKTDITGHSNFTQINSSGVVNNIYITHNSITHPLENAVAWWTNLNGDEKTYYQSNSIYSSVIFDKDNNVLLEKTCANTVGDCSIQDSKIFPSCHKSFFDFWDTSCSTEWKLAVATYNDVGTANPDWIVTAYNLDGSTYWTKTLQSGGGSSTSFAGTLAVDDDYNGDGYADIFTAFVKVNSITPRGISFYVLSGRDGATLWYKNITDPTPQPSSANNHLTIADLDHDGRSDFIYTYGANVWAYNMYDDVIYINKTLADNDGYCNPADINLDGFLEILCSGATLTTIFSSNFTNTNSIINNVIFDPATTIAVNTNLNVVVNAFDQDSNQIYYFIKCNDTSNFVSTTSSSYCLYSTAGIYNLTVGVRDGFHSSMNEFSQIITVTQTGFSCNSNGICESGETFGNCPSDCTSGGSSVNNQSSTVQTANGTANIPVNLVDTENTNSGLLPEVYYGLLGFFSYIAIPLIIVVFLIFTVLIVLAFATIIKNISHKAMR